MNLPSRISRAIRAFRSAPDLKIASQQIDNMIANKQLEVPTELKQKKSASRLDVRHTTTDQQAYYFNFLRYWTVKGIKTLPPYGDISRDEFLATCWQQEPILAGAIYSMIAKMSSLQWSITGRRLVSREAARTFANAAYIGGYEWGGFISSTAEDFYTADRGAFWELARGGRSYTSRLIGNLEEIGHMDTLNCWLTGNTKYPVVYTSSTIGQTIKFKSGEFVHFASMPSSREDKYGIGFCAVSRAYSAAKLLMGLHDYDTEKLSNLPPEGVAAVTGLTMDEFNDAITLWMTKRQQDSSLTFPQVLWLIGSQPNAEVSVNMTPFSSIPESFDRQSVVDHYVATLALCFGVDAREFWPITSGALGSASESEIQHLKAKGKGPGEFISTIERHLNAELPEDSSFAFDTQDIQEDMIAAQVAKAWIDAFWPLYQGIPNPNIAPPPQLGGSGLPSTPGNKPGQVAGQQAGARPPAIGKVSAIANKQDEEIEEPKKDSKNSDKQTEQVLTKEQFMRLLADKGVIPDYLVDDSRVMIQDTDIHISKEGHPDDYTKYTWKAGVLKEERLPAIILTTRSRTDAPYAGVDYATKPDETVYGVLTKEGLSIVDAITFLEAKEAEILEKERNIRGEPIPDKEVERGGGATVKTISAELERWRKHPILQKYALNPEEEKKLLETLTKNSTYKLHTKTGNK